jgi:CheY-like chemotaxis protein
MPKVLVIDDNPDSAESLARLLRVDGNDVVAVTSGPGALDALAGFTPDVCLIDIRMPGMDGFAVADHLRRLLGPAVRLLALTGAPDAVADPRAAVFDRVLTKPPDVDTLLGTVEGTSGT